MFYTITAGSCPIYIDGDTM